MGLKILNSTQTLDGTDVEEDKTVLEALATPELHEEEAKEKFYDPEVEEAMGSFEDDWNDLEMESPEEVDSYPSKPSPPDNITCYKS
ncbi:hypothetical protein NDU88_004509 [Pleurodeles waltl]|uniref:Uncharacterized protein n=1 Tax=Pleurodeles waltl TaxID=8319 RepID=A0AAV7NSP4_PLEWA|nr:hypothetical protein NDU88_004509 [Pleurodeles waltl]